MIKVCLLGFDYAVATSITGVVDLLSTAGTAWNYFQGRNLEPKFDVRVATAGGRPIRCLNNMVLDAHLDFRSIGQVDMLIVPSIGGDVECVVRVGLSAQIGALEWEAVDAAHEC